MTHTELFENYTSKNVLRKKYKAVRNSLSADTRAVLSGEICRRICALVGIQNAGAVMNYAAQRSEVDTDAVSEYILSHKKTLLLPVTDINTQTMHASKADFVHMERGGYGIAEPCDKTEFCADGIDAIIAPALVYNRNGFRIGYGKGYYDRFFAQCRNALKIGAAYSVQICSEAFEAAHDMPVDIIVTENEVIYCGKTR